MKADVNDVYEQGREDYYRGSSPEHNPYTDSRLAQAWVQGLRAACEEHRATRGNFFPYDQR